MKEYAKIVTSGKSTQTCSSTFRKLKVLDVGGKDGTRASTEFYPGSDVTVIDLKTGWDVMKSGVPDGDWDVILANHFIEHIEKPDFFLDECKMVMKRDTILDIGTPNLAAWFNRILFLFGYVPHSMELSKRFNVGKPFDWGHEELGGHIFVYTVPALCELLVRHGFKLLEVTGEASTFKCHPAILWLDKTLTDISPNFASAFRVKCKLRY